MFRVMGVITFDRKHFSKNRSFVYCACAGMCVWRGGGGVGSKDLGFFFSGHFRIFGGIATI